MPKLCVCLLAGCAVLFGAPAAAPASGQAPLKQLPAAAAVPSDAQALADKIDQHLAAAWAAAKVKPAGPSEDSEFLRRAYLDLAGRIPTVTEARQFLDDKRPDRRQRLVDHLLKSPRYAAHHTRVWR